MAHTTLAEILKQDIKLTPMMEQYAALKKDHMDDIMFFRMGDFYEVFFEDAKRCSEILNIAMTHRGKIGGIPIPMAGMPHHAASAYIDRITEHGLKVAVCEQIQDPKDAVGIVKRAVVQVVSPGMPYDLERTQGHEHRFMSAAYEENGFYFLTALDFTTGEFFGQKLKSSEDFLEALRLIGPSEFVTHMGQFEDLKPLDQLLEAMGTLKTRLSEDYFNPKVSHLYTEKLIPGHNRDKILKLNKEVLAPIGALSFYVCSTQQLDDFFHIRPFKMRNDEDRLKVTLPTLVGLEILPKSRETYKDSLLGYFNKTKSALGSRALRKQFMTPVRSKEVIHNRQNLIKFLLEDIETLESIREELTGVRDLERILAKTGTNRATAGDLLNIASSFRAYEKLDTLLGKGKFKVWVDLNKKQTLLLEELTSNIEKTINDEIGATLEKGNLIKKGANKKRDRLSKLSQNAHNEMNEMEERYRNETGIPKLRIKYNNVAGYFIEVSKTHSNKVPKTFERRQTLVNSERYTTPELDAFEKEMLSAKEKLERLEREIFKDLVSQVNAGSNEIQKMADLVALVDVFQSFTWMALQENLSCPIVHEKKKIIKLKGAWHPLIKSVLSEKFVPHNLELTKDCFFGLITGPNMAGKTTVMREVAIIQLLAQMGSFVPAESAELGLCDHLFSRLGASDDILKGQSTFMVEMAETAEIIRHATENSLIILDEVGRGTSTYDGLSIAWSLCEHFLSETKAITLFATHYHELIDLADKEAFAKNLTVETQNNNGDVQFLYNLVERAASQSFGIYVAKMAGLPQKVLLRSQELLMQLENGSDNQIDLEPKKGSQLSMFPSEEQVVIPEHLKKIDGELQELDIMNMTPLEAMKKLHDLQLVAENQVH
ncbi:MAG: DNA mismatch repair protein MutS [Bacteriovoracaceae bacterium]